MSKPQSRFLLNYLLGIASIALGAGATSATDSMVPLSMGGAIGLMCAWSLVTAIRQGRMRPAPQR